LNIRQEKAEAKSALFTFVYTRIDPGEMIKVRVHGAQPINDLTNGCQLRTSRVVFAGMRNSMPGLLCRVLSRRSQADFPGLQISLTLQVALHAWLFPPPVYLQATRRC
jgi:hypothetical protein